RVASPGDAVRARVRHHGRPPARRPRCPAPSPVERRRHRARTTSRDRPDRSTPMTTNRELRIATLIVAPLLAAVSTLSARDESLLHRAAPALVILWMIMVCAIVLRPDFTAHEDCEIAIYRRSIWNQLDVLTASGT